MAIGFSNNQLNYAQKKYYGRFYQIKKNSKDLKIIQKIINKILIYSYFTKYSLVNFKRRVYRFIHSSFNKKIEKEKINFSINLNEKTIQNASNNLNLNNFAFIENFLSEQSYDYLINNWPNINYFNHNKKIIKHYNSIVNWNINMDHKIIETFKLKKFYKFLLSKEFEKFYKKIINFEKVEYKIYMISSSMASKDSFLIPHIDGIFKYEAKKQNYNFIYFVDGYNQNPSVGGGTGIFKDSEFKLPIFEPHTIKNSLLIYNQSKEFYHGFRTIECPKDIYRKTVNLKIIPASQI